VSLNIGEKIISHQKNILDPKKITLPHSKKITPHTIKKHDSQSGGKKLRRAPRYKSIYV
jgi:hypothetical protein